MSDRNNESLIKSPEDGVKLYNQLKFDVAAEGYKINDRQILSPSPICVLCGASGVGIKGAKVNDNLTKVQTIASLCEECCKRLNNLSNEDIEDSRVQNMIRFFFSESADKIINGQFAQKRMEKYPPIYIEYWALLKWTLEEKMMRELMHCFPIEQTDRYTTVRSGDCCSCSVDLSDESGIGDPHEHVNLFSPTKQCWCNLELCAACAKQLKLDMKDLTHEIRTTYFEKYEDLEDLPKRDALEILCRMAIKMKTKVLFLDTEAKLEHVINILNSCGVDEENQIIKKITEDDSDETMGRNENVQEAAQE